MQSPPSLSCLPMKSCPVAKSQPNPPTGADLPRRNLTIGLSSLSHNFARASSSHAVLESLPVRRAICVQKEPTPIKSSPTLNVIKSDLDGSNFGSSPWAFANAQYVSNPAPAMPVIARLANSPSSPPSKKFFINPIDERV